MKYEVRKDGHTIGHNALRYGGVHTPADLKKLGANDALIKTFVKRGVLRVRKERAVAENFGATTPPVAKVTKAKATSAKKKGDV